MNDLLRILQKLCPPGRGKGGVSQKMILNYDWVRRGQAKDDEWLWWGGFITSSLEYSN